MNSEIITAHKHSSDHAREIRSSECCGCFYCLSIFTPDKIREWVDDGACAICPYCGIDSVIGSASGYPITQEFLQGMKAHWF